MSKLYLERIFPGFYSEIIATKLPVDLSEAPYVLLPSQVSIANEVTTKTTNYTITATDNIILANAANSVLTITLPDATVVTGKAYIIKKIDSSANAVTIATTNTQTIDGNTTVIISTQYQSYTMISDGANWQIT